MPPRIRPMAREAPRHRWTRSDKRDLLKRTILEPNSALNDVSELVSIHRHDEDVHYLAVKCWLCYQDGERRASVFIRHYVFLTQRDTASSPPEGWGQLQSISIPSQCKALYYNLRDHQYLVFPDDNFFFVNRQGASVGAPDKSKAARLAWHVAHHEELHISPIGGYIINSSSKLQQGLAVIGPSEPPADGNRAEPATANPKAASRAAGHMRQTRLPQNLGELHASRIELLFEKH